MQLSILINNLFDNEERERIILYKKKQVIINLNLRCNISDKSAFEKRNCYRTRTLDKPALKNEQNNVF
jgi:hypothetical protein